MVWSERVPERYGHYWVKPPGTGIPHVVWADGEGGYRLTLDPVRYTFSGDETGTLYAGPIQPPEANPTVYVAFWWDYDSVGNVGVYSTRGNAEAAIAECRKVKPHLPYDIEEHVIDATASTPYPHTPAEAKS